MSSPGTAPAKTADSSHSERALYSKIYANAPESVFLINPSGGHILFANPKAQEDTSYELSELEGLDFRRLFFPEDKEAIEALLQATQQWNNGSDPIRILRRKSGKKIFVEISTLLVDFGGKPTIAASVRDITARVKAEHKVREYSRELEKINAELEDRVKARTAELAKANEMLQATNALITARKKELDDVMNNIQQAILTIAPSGRINPEFSRFALDVFGERTISGADLVEFLFPPEERTSRGESLKGWLKTVYEQPELWEMVKDFGVRELSYLRPNADGTFERRDLQFEWRPVYENDQIAKMMLVGWDITEQKRLQAEIEKKEAAHREELELISQLIHQPREVVEQFVSDFDRNLREGLENLGQGPDSLGPEQIKALLRALHTIKGSAKQFGLQSIQRQAHDLEGRLTGAGEKGAGPALYAQIREDFEALEKSLGGILEIYAKVTQGSAGKGSAGGAFPAGPVFPVPVDKLDSLIRRVFTHEGPVPAPAVRRALAWLFHEPVSNLFDRLETLARKLAPELGKEIEVEREGDSIQLDHRLLVLLHDAFAHAVRNSLDHGAEGPDDRKLAGKPPAALLRFRARKLDGNRVEIEIEDDGRGIDVERVRMKAVEKGLVNPYAAQQASAADAMAFIFLPGFSTRDTASEVSGRGVGLDVLKETVANRLHGRVYVQSTPGKGTRVGARFDANALIGGTVNAIGYVSSPELKTAWEQTFGIHLKEPGTEGSDDLPLLTELDLAAHASNVSREKTVILGELEPKQIIDRIVGEMGIHHFVHARNKHAAPYVRTTLRKLSGDFAWGLEPYLWPAAPITTKFVQKSSQKTAVIQELTQWASTLKCFSGLTEILGTIADELLMNAIYDAPRDLFGEAKYNHLSRTDEVVLEAKEQVKFRWGADPETVGLSIEDTFGALNLETAVASIQRSYAEGPKRATSGGAGMGIYMIYENSHCFVINSQPGKRTEVIALVSLGRSYEEYQRGGRCFSFFKV